MVLLEWRGLLHEPIRIGTGWWREGNGMELVGLRKRSMWAIGDTV